MSAELTAVELAAWLDPRVTPNQLAAILALNSVAPAGRRLTGKRGRPPLTYDAAAVQRAHAAELARSPKGFADNDWAAMSALAHGLISVDAEHGVIYDADGSRAEYPQAEGYGLIYVGPLALTAQRVVWISVFGPPPRGLQVQHVNTLRWDNKISNLELVEFRGIERAATVLRVTRSQRAGH